MGVFKREKRHVKALALSKIIGCFRESWQGLPDYRKANNNTQYSLADAGLAAFSTFFMQTPSLLAYQRTMEQNKGRSNSQSLFQLEKIPSDAQIRNLLDPLTPDQFDREYQWVVAELAKSGQLQPFRDHEQTLLVALDGLTTIHRRLFIVPSAYNVRIAKAQSTIITAPSPRSSSSQTRHMCCRYPLN